jgi:hypothetical protein
VDLLFGHSHSTRENAKSETDDRKLLHFTYRFLAEKPRGAQRSALSTQQAARVAGPAQVLPATGSTLTTPTPTPWSSATVRP